jgi:Ni,Fe-hydrogenase maturation factor
MYLKKLINRGILMEQKITPELLEFRELIAGIRAETDLMKKVILSEEEEKEENEILCKFRSVVETQVFSTIVKLAIYQLREWRELIDE